MQSSVAVAGMDALSETPRKHFDTSGKSAALFHHRAICKTPIALPKNRRFGATSYWISIAAAPPGRGSYVGAFGTGGFGCSRQIGPCCQSTRPAPNAQKGTGWVEPFAK